MNLKATIMGNRRWLFGFTLGVVSALVFTGVVTFAATRWLPFSLALSVAAWSIATAGLSAAVVMLRRLENIGPRRVRLPPGWGLHRVASWLFSHRAFEEVLEPVLSDTQVEFLKALSEGRLIKARWIQLRGYGYFWTHVLAMLPTSLARALLAIWRSAS